MHSLILKKVKTPSEAKNINCPKLPKYLQHYHVSTITVELIRAFGNFIKHFLVLKFQSKSLMGLWTELLYKVIIKYLYPINTYHTFSGATNIRTWDCGMGSDKHSFRLSHPIDCYKSQRSLHNESVSTMGIIHCLVTKPSVLWFSGIEDTLDTFSLESMARLLHYSEWVTMNFYRITT